jgi:hypothetical protein
VFVTLDRSSQTVPFLQAVVTPLPLRGGEKLLRLLFEPLGWSVHVDPIVGPDEATISNLYARVKLIGVARLSALLNHLYVLIPVLDDAKHYWVGEDETDKLLKRGEGWLAMHPRISSGFVSVASEANAISPFVSLPSVMRR